MYLLFVVTQNEARKMNYQEVVEEDRRNKLPANWEAKQKRVEWELEDHKAGTVSWITNKN